MDQHSRTLLEALQPMSSEVIAI